MYVNVCVYIYTYINMYIYRWKQEHTAAQGHYIGAMLYSAHNTVSATAGDVGP
jgi:hypothetical protein